MASHPHCESSAPRQVRQSTEKKVRNDDGRSRGRRRTDCMLSFLTRKTASVQFGFVPGLSAVTPSMMFFSRIFVPVLCWIGLALEVSSFLPPTRSRLFASSVVVRRAAAATHNENDVPDMADTGFVLLAGGTGSRMKASMPKQFLELRGVPVLHHSLDLFLERLPVFLEESGKTSPSHVVLVMDPSYQPEYQPIVDLYKGRLHFANPGVERQGSVENGLNKLVQVSSGKCQYAAIHDSARPLVTIEEVCHVVADAKQTGAAVLGVPCKATIKESEDGETVLRTIPRARLWEVHTPQVIKIDTLLEGFQKVAAENLEVTDDVSIVEAMGLPVKLTLGEYTNLKITTPEDMDVAEAILEERGTSIPNMTAKAAAASAQ